MLALALACSGETPGRDEASTAGDAPPPATGAALSWSVTTLPDGVEPVTVTAVEGRSTTSAGVEQGGADPGVLVGGRAPEGSRVRPRLYLAGTGPLREVAVRPTSPTAYEARWMSVAVTGDGQVTAIGGAPAGAHSNTRWFTWSGSLAGGVAEAPQPFETFGGWGAGAVSALVSGPGGGLLVGSWQSAVSGQDIVTWRQRGERWERTSPAATALESRADLLPSAWGATSRGDGALIAGSVTALAPGQVSLRPAVWTAPTLDGPWTRTDLPADAPGETHAASCDSRSCTVVGRVDGRTAAWELTSERANALPGMPAWPVPDKGVLTAPIRHAVATTLFAAHDGRVHALTRRDGRWTDQQGPSGDAVLSAALSGRVLYLVVRDGERAALWSAAYGE